MVGWLMGKQQRAKVGLQRAAFIHRNDPRALHARIGMDDTVEVPTASGTKDVQWTFQSWLVSRHAKALPTERENLSDVYQNLHS
jgi:hypothetical protein